MSRAAAALLVAAGACRLGYDPLLDDAPTGGDAAGGDGADGGPACANSIWSDFEPPTLTTGTVHQQGGWSSAGAAGMGSGLYDHEVVANVFGWATFGSQSLRMSNAVTSGSYSDHTFTP